MHEKDILELMKHRIVSFETVENKPNVIKVNLTVNHFERTTTKPYWFTHEDWQESLKRGYIWAKE